MPPLSFRRLVLSCLALLTASGCMTGPHNGTTTGDSVIGETFLFEGYYPEPSTPVSLQVLREPDLDPTVAANWQQFATAITTTTPTPFNRPEPLYHWSVTAAPVPNFLFSSRWPSGGLVKVRAVAMDPDGQTVLYTFDDITYADCFSLNATQPWNTLGTECQGLGVNRSALVSTRLNPVDLPVADRPEFLGRKSPGLGTEETEEYYEQIQAPGTLDAFRSIYGFATGSDVTATYYNDGDLGLGREMHCKPFAVPPSQVGLACYVKNYGVLDGAPIFGGSSASALQDAVARTNSFATVAMTFTPPGNAPNSVKFMVYDAAGFLTPAAQLDNTGFNTFVPGNCLSCHGIKANYDANTNSVVGRAQFLPFDVFSFRYSTATGFTQPAQADALRRLNHLVTLTGPSDGIREFIEGTYAPKLVSDVTAVANDTYVPPNWTNTKQKGLGLYRGVVKPYCRTCHMSSTDTNLDFLDQADFNLYSGAIKVDVCGAGHSMPNAEHVMKKFWKSGARAYLDLGLDMQSPCGP